MKINEYITDDERIYAWKRGYASYMNSHPGISKEAQSSPRPGKFSVPLKLAINTALVFGIPLGTAYYAAKKLVNSADSDTDKKRDEVEYYRDLVAQIHNNMSGSNE